MTRNRLLLIAFGLAVAASACLGTGLVLVNRDVGSYIAGHFQEYAHDADAKRYVCSGSPRQVADALARYKAPSVRATMSSNRNCIRRRLPRRRCCWPSEESPRPRCHDDNRCS